MKQVQQMVAACVSQQLQKPNNINVTSDQDPSINPTEYPHQPQHPPHRSQNRPPYPTGPSPSRFPSYGPKKFQTRNYTRDHHVNQKRKYNETTVSTETMNPPTKVIKLSEAVSQFKKTDAHGTNITMTFSPSTTTSKQQRSFDQSSSVNPHHDQHKYHRQEENKTFVPTVTRTFNPNYNNQLDATILPPPPPQQQKRFIRQQRFKQQQPSSSSSSTFTQ
jgi:hypothetical protein